MGSRVVDNAPHLRHYSTDGHEPVLFGDTIIIVFDLVGIAQSVVSQDKVHFSVSEGPLEGEGMELEQTRAVFLGGPLSLSGGMFLALRGSHVRERRRRHRLGPRVNGVSRLRRPTWVAFIWRGFGHGWCLRIDTHRKVRMLVGSGSPGRI